jgi:hypothetical protein
LDDRSIELFERMHENFCSQNPLSSQPGRLSLAKLAST